MGAWPSWPARSLLSGSRTRPAGRVVRAPAAIGGSIGASAGALAFRAALGTAPRALVSGAAVRAASRTRLRHGQGRAGAQCAHKQNRSEFLFHDELPIKRYVAEIL
ncbi:hypothetical protein B7O96_08390 [Bordetella holmesii]|nr:hypothetical protein B7O96_08390 [Bordetella holmesii]